MKKIAIACLFGLGLSMFSGCGGDTKKPDDKGAATTAAPDTKPADAPK